MTKRLVGVFIALVVAMLVFLGVPFLRVVERYERARLQTDLERDAVVLATEAEDQLSEGKPSLPVLEKLSRSYAERTGARVVIVDPKGILLADSSVASLTDSEITVRSMASRPEIGRALKGEFAAVNRRSGTVGYSSLYVAVPVASSGHLYGAVRVSFPTSDVNRRIAVQRTRLIAVGVLSAGVVALLGVWLARWLVGPVAKLAAVTQRFGGGELSVRAVTNDGPREMRNLATEFNAMAARLDDLVASQNAFVADASHELRSPLTAIRLQLEAMEYGEPGAVERRRLRALEEVTRLSRNVDGLLLIARQERGGVPLATVDVSSMLSARAKFWTPLAIERGLRVATSIPPTVMVRATLDRIATVLDNLFANAIDAAAPNTTISLRAMTNDDTVELHVTDEGPGMSDEQRVAAFDRFWRAGEARTLLSGSGLGLAIARKLVAADGGTIRLDSVLPTGIDAVVTFPSGQSELWR